MSTRDEALRGPRERKKQRTRERIRQVALGLFVANGYEQTKVEEIAHAARVSRQTFFNYFPEKSRLLDLLVEEADTNFEGLVRETLTESRSTEQRFRFAFTRSAKLMAAVPELARIIIVHGLARQAGPAVPRRAVSEVLLPVLAAGVAQGDVREDLPLPFLAEMSGGAFNAVVLTWIEDLDYPLVERAADAASFAAEAAAKRAGARFSRARQRGSVTAE